jgi:hypothetical protein
MGAFDAVDTFTINGEWSVKCAVIFYFKKRLMGQRIKDLGVTVYPLGIDEESRFNIFCFKKDDQFTVILTARRFSPQASKVSATSLVSLSNRTVTPETFSPHYTRVIY